MTRSRRQALVQWVGIGALLVAVSLALVGVRLQDQRIDVLSQALGDEQSAVEARGDEPVAPSAEDLIEDPEYAGPQGPPGPGPTDAQVYAAVADFFRVNPVEDGESPSPAAIAAAVTNYLAEHPPQQGEPGPAPTADQIAAAVQEYLTANPPAAGPPGEDGDDGAQGPPGEDGPPPTAEEIAAAVQEYIEEHPIPTCPAGSSAEPLTVLTTGGAADIIGCVVQDGAE